MGTYTDDEVYLDLSADVEAAPEYERLRIIDKMLNDPQCPIPSTAVPYLTKEYKLHLYNKFKPSAIRQRAEHLKRCLQPHQRPIDPADAFDWKAQPTPDNFEEILEILPPASQRGWWNSGNRIRPLTL